MIGLVHCVAPGTRQRHRTALVGSPLSPPASAGTRSTGVTGTQGLTGGADRISPADRRRAVPVLRADDLHALHARLRYCHVAAMRWNKLSSDGVIALEGSYDVSANVSGPMDQRKKAPPMVALEPRTLELVRRHRRYLMQRNHPGLQTGLLFPSEAGTRPVGNDQLNDVWREAQVMAGIECPVTIHGIRHSFHDLARQQRVPDAVVKAMAGRAGAEVARGQDKHLHYSRGVTVEEMPDASMALMRLVPTEPTMGRESRDASRDGNGKDRNSDDESAVNASR